TYTVKLNAVTEYGCRDSVEYNLIILDELLLFIPNSFSPNNDGINDEFSISSEGINTLKFIIFNRCKLRNFYNNRSQLYLGWFL
ncbi:gliding motility-associated C-terminal domain-containing protein, partial [Flavobacteriales bacterium]|nr:gliding motility-associated C-terminal domain-containing protein [Flavobacteriales bacterium]